MIYNFNNFIRLINEGLIKTYDIDKTISDIDDLLKMYNIKYNIIKKDNIFSIKVFDTNITSNIIDIIEIFLSSIFNLYGWFPSKMYLENIYGMKNSKKFDKDELFMYIKNLLSIEELGKIRTKSKLKTTINLTLVNELDFDLEKIKKHFDPKYFFIKLSPINKNVISESNSLGSGIIESINLI